MIRGLDAYITGQNDPSAPFNQVDWEDQYAPIIDACDWITDAMWADDKTYELLRGLLENDVLPIFIKPERHSKQSFQHFITVYAKMIAYRFKLAYKIHQKMYIA